MTLPTISFNNGLYYITLNLNKKQFYDYKSKGTSASQNSFIITLLSGLLQDTTGKITKGNSTAQPCSNPVLTNTTIAGIKVIDLNLKELRLLFGFILYL